MTRARFHERKIPSNPGMLSTKHRRVIGRRRRGWAHRRRHPSSRARATSRRRPLRRHVQAHIRRAVLDDLDFSLFQVCLHETDLSKPWSLSNNSVVPILFLFRICSTYVICVVFGWVKNFNRLGLILRCCLVIELQRKGNEIKAVDVTAREWK